tara:strand:+ start:513 stop:848 length:336 start_codon:yes stop_codon:yes gene_type:complete
LANYRKIGKPISRRMACGYSLFRPTDMQGPIACALAPRPDKCNCAGTALDARIAAFADGDMSSCDALSFTVSTGPASVAPLPYRTFGMVCAHGALALGDSVFRHLLDFLQS